MNPELSTHTETNHQILSTERPLVEKLWSRWEKFLAVGFIASVVLGGALTAISFAGTSHVQIPELAALVDNVCAPTALFFGASYLVSKGIGAVASGLREVIRDLDTITHH